MSWTCVLLLFVEFNDIGVCVEIWGRRDAERSSADQLRKGILRTEELSSRGDSGGLKGSTVTEEWVAENDRSHHSYESSLWEMWGKDAPRWRLQSLFWNSGNFLIRRLGALHCFLSPGQPSHSLKVRHDRCLTCKPSLVTTSGNFFNYFPNRFTCLLELWPWLAMPMLRMEEGKRL